jgi:hypothetical protein
VKRNKKDIQPNWRPNFRNPEKLPDIKAVRTDFIVNFVAVSLALLALAFVGQREYRVLVLKGSIADYEQQIRVAEPDDAANLKLSQRYREAAQHFVELEQFYRGAFFAHELLGELAVKQPPDLIFNQISYSETVGARDNAPFVGYTVGLVGEVKELPVLDAFKATLGQTEVFAQDRFEAEIGESVQSRDAKTNIFPYRINISLQPAEPDDAGKKEDSES